MGHFPPGISLQTAKALKTIIRTRCSALEVSTPGPKQFHSEQKHQSQQNIQRQNQSSERVKSVEYCLCFET